MNFFYHLLGLVLMLGGTSFLIFQLVIWRKESAWKAASNKLYREWYTEDLLEARRADMETKINQEFTSVS